MGVVWTLLTMLFWVTPITGAQGVLSGVTFLDDIPGVHHLFLLSTNIYSGGAPEGESGFAALRELGIKTIISVDGKRPEVELARRYGIRYAHLPHGYDGISPAVQSQLANAGQTLERPIFIHCHHGKHRGPAAAAIICMADEGWSAAQAEAWLRRAGTATNYAGPYDAVRNFRKSDNLGGFPLDFPEYAKVERLVDAMVSIDQRWDNLKEVREAGYRAPTNHPDINPANEAVLLWEHFREAQRLPDAERRGKQFVEQLTLSEAKVKEVEQLLRAFVSTNAAAQHPIFGSKGDISAQLDRAFNGIASSCTSCHDTYRDNPKIHDRSGLRE